MKHSNVLHQFFASCSDDDDDVSSHVCQRVIPYDIGTRTERDKSKDVLEERAKTSQNDTSENFYVCGQVSGIPSCLLPYASL